MRTIRIQELTGDFAENKDVAKELRNRYILPALENNEQLLLDFKGVTGATQSFIHAAVAEAIRRYPENFYSRIIFKNCSDLVKTVVDIVSEYMQESLSE